MWNAIKITIAALLLYFIWHTPDLKAEEPTAWDYYVEKHYPNAEFITDQDFLMLDTPKRAFSGAQVPISLHLKENKHNIESLSIYIDNNPKLHAVTYDLTDKTQVISFDMRIRMEIDSSIRVIAKTDEGKLYMHVDHTRASGGCSGYADPTDPYLLKNLGRIKLQVKDGVFISRIKYPNFTGLQRHHESGGYVPKNIIEKVTFEHKGEAFLTANHNISISANPYLTFTLPSSIMEHIDVEASTTSGEVYKQHYHGGK